MALLNEDEVIIRKGRLTLNQTTISNVKCRVKKPLRHSGEMKVDFEWVSKSGVMRPGFGSFEFDTEVDAPGPWAKERVRLLNVHVFSTTSQITGIETQEIHAQADAGALEFCRILNDSNRSGKWTHLSLVLTPNRMLEPTQFDEISYTGVVRRKLLDQLQMNVPRLGKVVFDYHFDWFSNSERDVRQSRRYLVATMRTRLEALDSEGILNSVVRPFEDLLLLAGFASRTPTRCAGWISSSDNSAVEYYKRGVWLPDGKQRHRTIVNGGLIELGDLEKFLVNATPIFQSSPVRPELTQAFFALNNSPEQTIERRFLSLFSAFEGVVNGLVKVSVFDETTEAQKRSAEKKEARKRTSEKLIRFLDQMLHEEEITEEVRDEFKKIISHIPQTSFAKKFKVVCENLSFQHSDLWPLIGQGKTKSLYIIRNMLAHGAMLDEHQIESLICANHHIEWLLERLVCTVLQWPIQDTDLSYSALLSYWSNNLVDWQIVEKSFHLHE